jgi:hypothetical protein
MTAAQAQQRPPTPVAASDEAMLEAFALGRRECQMVPTTSATCDSNPAENFVRVTRCDLWKEQYREQQELALRTIRNLCVRLRSLDGSGGSAPYRSM